MEKLLFPFAEYWWFYAGFTVLVLGLLALDLGVFHKKSHVVTFKEALGWTIVWIALAAVFNVGMWQYATARFGAELGSQVGLEFLTGYVVEKALAVDNIFVFAMVFTYFAIPPLYQHRILFYGILGALVFRAGFIALGSWLMQIHWVVIAAGVFLILTGAKMFFAGGGESDPEKNPILRLIRRFVRVTPELHGERFFIRKEGVLYGTPLLVALLFIEASDIVFAIDSVPAIFAITREPLLVFTSNIFAILGLRSMFFMLASVLDRFHLLKYGLASILVFVGLKMVWLNDAFGGKFPIGLSLGIIGALLAVSIGASLLLPPRRGEKSGPDLAGA